MNNQTLANALILARNAINSGKSEIKSRFEILLRDVKLIQEIDSSFVPPWEAKSGCVPIIPVETAKPWHGVVPACNNTLATAMTEHKSLHDIRRVYRWRNVKDAIIFAVHGMTINSPEHKNRYGNGEIAKFLTEKGYTYSINTISGGLLKLKETPDYADPYGRQVKITNHGVWRFAQAK